MRKYVSVKEGFYIKGSIVLDYTKEKYEQATEITEEQCIAFFFFSFFLFIT